MKKIIKKSVNWFLITLFILLGFVGLILPFVPQAIFFAMALILISFEIPQVENYLDSKISKESFFGKIYYSLRSKFEKYLR